MTKNNNKLSTNEAWRQLLDKYPIMKSIKEKGYYKILSSQIRALKEPRLMAKWDSSTTLPEVLKAKHINILPISRSAYILGDFELYQPLPPLEERVEHMDYVELPIYESISADKINSEAIAINFLLLSGMLDDFLGTNHTVATFNGRMGTGEFDFRVNALHHSPCNISVHNAQCEIDGGFENDESVIILEAKNVAYGDFNVRQLYYPYRLWADRVKKPIRLVFSLYSNLIYRLFEYQFTTKDNYSSIVLINQKNYSLQDTRISERDLLEVRQCTKVVTDDNRSHTNIPFLQANSFERVISLLEKLYENPMTDQQIADFMNFTTRQSGYYYNAGRYLGLFQKKESDGQTTVNLTSLGEQVFRLSYKRRQLELVSLLLQHQIFADSFDYVVSTGTLPEADWIQRKMRLLNVCGEQLIGRRSNSILGWIKWMFTLQKL